MNYTIDSNNVYNFYLAVCTERNIQPFLDLSDFTDTDVTEVVGVITGSMFEPVSENPDDWDAEIAAEIQLVESTEACKAFVASNSHLF